MSSAELRIAEQVAADVTRSDTLASRLLDASYGAMRRAFGSTDPAPSNASEMLEHMANKGITVTGLVKDGQAVPLDPSRLNFDGGTLATKDGSAMTAEIALKARGSFADLLPKSIRAEKFAMSETGAVNALNGPGVFEAGASPMVQFDRDGRVMNVTSISRFGADAPHPVLADTPIPLRDALKTPMPGPWQVTETTALLSGKSTQTRDYNQLVHPGSDGSAIVSPYHMTFG